MDPNNATNETDGRLLYLVEHLTSLHGAPDMPSLAGRFEFLGEHALAASLTALVIPDEAQSYRAVRSSGPRPASAQALWDDLAFGGLASSESASALFHATQNSAKPQRFELEQLAGDAAKERTESVIAAPIAFNREVIGVGIFLVQDPDKTSDTVAHVIASHAAVAIYQLREREDARRLHSVDAKLWVPDEDFLRAQLQRELTRARRYGRDLGIALLRLENESAVRARFGDFYTGHLMRRIGGQLLGSVRDTDILGALDGAYAVLHTDTGPDGTGISAYRLRDSVVKMVAQKFPEAPAADMSVRVASYPASGDSVEALITHLREDAAYVATTAA